MPKICPRLTEDQVNELAVLLKSKPDGSTITKTQVVLMLDDKKPISDIQKYTECQLENKIVHY